MLRRRRSNISQQTRNAIRLQNIANQSTEEERQNAREERRVSIGRLRASQTEEQIVIVIEEPSSTPGLPPA